MSKPILLTENYNPTDVEYNHKLSIILDQGKMRSNRTGTKALTVFGLTGSYDQSEGFSILTTKKVNFKAIVHELLWFISGSTNIKPLVDAGVNIWNDDAWRHYNKIMGGFEQKIKTKEEFIEKVKTSKYPITGAELGYGTYGSMWRRFPSISQDIEDTNTTIDQLSKAIQTLKTDPTDRRIIVNSCHPDLVEYIALPPCHVMFQFDCEELTPEEKEQTNKTHKLNLAMYQRSCDMFLGVPFNITSYALLLHLVAHCVDMVPGEFVHFMANAHIYENHIEQCKTQIGRDSFRAPVLKLNPSVRDLFAFKPEDIELVGYKHHEAIKGELSVG